MVAACQSSSQSVTCTWPELGIDDVKIITIEAKSVQAGTWEAIAAVMSGEDDLDSANNRAGVSVSVKVSIQLGCKYIQAPLHLCRAVKLAMF